MHISMKLSVVFCLLLSIAGVASTFSADDNEKVVEGFVYYADGNTAMPNVEVRVHYNVNDYAKSDTDSNGHYRVKFKKQSGPIKVRYIPLGEQILFPDLLRLSGTVSHEISRTAPGKKSAYSPARATELYERAREDRALMDSMPAAERVAMENYYRGLLDSVTIEQGAIADETTRQFLQLKQNQTRSQYGLPDKPLTNETGAPVKGFWGTRGRELRHPKVKDSMTDDLFKPDDILGALVGRICSSTPLPGLGKTELHSYRKGLGCAQPATKRPSEPGKQPPPNMNRVPGNSNKSPL